MLKKLTIVFSVIIISINHLSFSQENQSNQTLFITNKSKAILFGIDKDLYIDSFLGTAFSAKKHFSTRSALRAGLSLSFDYGDERYRYDSQTSSAEEENKEESLSYSISSTIEYLHYVDTKSRIYFYMGIGPQLSYQWTHSKHYEKYQNFWEEDNKSDFNKWSLGLHTSLGIECFLTKNISLLAEYGLTLYYEKGSSDRSYEDQSTYNSENKYFRIQSNAKKLGVSFYL